MFARLGAATAAALLLAGATSPPDDAAARFGARENVVDLSLSPDGTRVAYIAPTSGQGAAVFTLGTDPGAKARLVVTASGDPDRIQLVTWSKLDHYLEDSAARTEMLRKSDALLRETMHL